MSNIHASHIEKLKNDFENIMAIKSEIIKLKNTVASKLEQLKIVYGDLLRNNNKKILLFCLDSFFFQYKVFCMEIENIDQLRLLLDNRMYCDYYKLYQIVLGKMKEQVSDDVISEIETKSYPVYKDLEPFQEYKQDDIKDIHSAILLFINCLFEQSNQKESDIEKYNDTHCAGFSISNFLNTLGYENNILKEQISLYVNYVSFFHISQKTQLMRIFSRMQDFYKEVEENIHTNKTFSIHDIKEDQRTSRFYMVKEELTVPAILTSLAKSTTNTKDASGNSKPAPVNSKDASGNSKDVIPKSATIITDASNTKVI